MFLDKAIYVKIKLDMIGRIQNIYNKNIQFVMMQPVTVWHSDALHRQGIWHNRPKYPSGQVDLQFQPWLPIGHSFKKQKQNRDIFLKSFKK